MIKKIKNIKNHSRLINRLLVANIVVVSLLCISAKRVAHNANQQQIPVSSHDNLLTLDQATTSFGSYMRNIVKQRKLPHSTAQQEHDLINTELELINNATGPTAHDLVPLADLIGLKQAYKGYLQTLYPKEFAATINAETTISRNLAKKRIQAEVLEILDGADQKQKRSLWKQIKYSFVCHQLDQATFLDDTNNPVITKQDFDQIRQKTIVYVYRNFKTKKISNPRSFITKVKGFFNKKNQINKQRRPGHD